MSRTSIYNALSATGIATAHLCFPTENAPSLPFCVFYTDEDRSFFADDKRMVDAPIWTVELYEASADETTESLIESAISAIGPFTRTEAWLSDEDCLMVTYIFKSMKG